jgi:hypothetical protein
MFSCSATRGSGQELNRVEQFGFCFGPHLVWWEMVALAIHLIWFGFKKKIVWFGLVVALLKSIRNRVETLRLWKHL